MPIGRRIPICLGLLAAACLPSVRPAGQSLQSGVSAGGASAPPSAQVDKGKSESRKTPASFDLEKFLPLLAESSLSEVRALVDKESHGEAAHELGKTFDLRDAENEETPSLELARRSYLAGLLHRAADQKKEALLSFERASARDWILRDDALLAAGQLQLEQGKHKAALRTSEKLETLANDESSLRLQARAHAGTGDTTKAISFWKRLSKTSQGASDQVELAGLYLESAEAEEPGKARLERLELAAQTASAAAIGLPEDDELAQRAKRLLERVAKVAPSVVKTRDLAGSLDDLKGLVERRAFEEALAAARDLSLPAKPRFSSERCRRDFWVSKALAGQRKWGEAADKVGSAAEHCTEDPELHAWLLFNGGKFNAADGRHTKAIRFYADLERLYPKNSLADDSRLRMAKSYKRQGVMARYISLLASLPETYPEGDMTMEGVLLLALHRMERSDWSGASQVLTRAARIVRPTDSARGHEHAGTERYFLARCMQELGQEEQALAEFESIVVEVPLSYYMLHAYSRLLDADPERAKEALSRGLSRANKTPFSFPHRPEYETPEFQRGMELLRVGDTQRGQAVIASLGLGEGADESLLWGIALLYDRAGDAHQSHGIARGRLSDWFAHYPEGDWRGAWEIGFPRPYHSIVERESAATGVPEWLIYGVMREESTFRPRVVSHANAYGLMQVIIPTARGIGKKAGLPYSASALKRPAVNIAIGSRVLKELGRRFRENPWLAIPGYNAGPGRPARWLRERPNIDFDVWVEMIPYRETRRYTKRVLASRAAYAFTYHRQDAQTALVLPKRLTFPRP